MYTYIYDRPVVVLLDVHTASFMSACIHMHTHAHIHTHKHTDIHTRSASAPTHLQRGRIVRHHGTYTILYIHVCMHACIHTSTHACIHTHMHACMHPSMHIQHTPTSSAGGSRGFVAHILYHTYIHACLCVCMHAYRIERLRGPLRRRLVRGNARRVVPTRPPR